MQNTRMLCVSIHDVSAATWPACERVIASIEQIARLPLSLLVVPHWHRARAHSELCASRFEAALSLLQANGHELCLHGHVHLDEGAGPVRAVDWVRRRILTRSEAEFAALDRPSAAQKLKLGLDYFAAHGWNARGFVPPAWMISPAALHAVRAAGFAYLGLYRSWLRLADGKQLPAPSLTYSTRHRLGDALFRRLQDILSWREQQSPVLRLALHPADVLRPANLAHAQRLIEHCLKEREPLTEYEAFTRSDGCPM